MPLGSWDIEVYGQTVPQLVCWPLSEVPPGPWAAEDLLPFLLPYAASAPRVAQGGDYYLSDPLASYPLVATFDHPRGYGPLEIAALALVWLYDPPVLSSPPVALAEPVTTLEGQSVDIPLYRTVLASRVEE